MASATAAVSVAAAEEMAACDLAATQQASGNAAWSETMKVNDQERPMLSVNVGTMLETLHQFRKSVVDQSALAYSESCFAPKSAQTTQHGFLKMTIKKNL